MTKQQTTQPLKSLLVVGFLLLSACGGGGSTNTSSTPPPQPPDLRTTWGSHVSIGNLPTSGTRFFKFANIETQNPTLTWGEVGGFLEGTYPGFSEYQNGGWTKPSFPFAGSQMSAPQAIGDAQGNLTLIGTRLGEIQATTRQGGIWGPITTVAKPRSIGEDTQENYPIGTLVGLNGLLVGWKQPLISNSYKYEIFVTRRVSGQWITDFLDTNVDGGLRLRGNPDGTAFATWYKGNQLHLARFSNGAWEPAKPLNVVGDGYGSMNFYRYLILCKNGNNITFLTTTQVDGGLHVTVYDGTQLQETVYPQNRIVDLNFTGDIADDGSIIAGWSNPDSKSVYARILKDGQWGTQFQASGGICGAQIININQAIVLTYQDDSGVFAVDCLSGAWQPKKSFISSLNIFGITLGRTTQKQWLAAWDVFSSSGSGNSETLYVTLGKPSQ